MKLELSRRFGREKSVDHPEFLGVEGNIDAVLPQGSVESHMSGGVAVAHYVHQHVGHETRGAYWFEEVVPGFGRYRIVSDYTINIHGNRIHSKTSFKAMVGYFGDEEVVLRNGEAKKAKEMTPALIKRAERITEELKLKK